MQRRHVPDRDRALARDRPEIRDREAGQGEDQAEADERRDPRPAPDEQGEPYGPHHRRGENGHVGQAERNERRS
jgi:hypothetical protein